MASASMSSALAMAYSISFGAMPWRLTSRQVDLYFAGPGKRGRSTMRQKLNRIDGYFTFLEQRYAGD